MVLESTIICIDNSEWMRNGDYAPSRFQAQADAVNLICGAKTQSNPENTVGILTMGGKGVRVLVTPTSDLGKILGSFHGLEIGGEMNMTAGIQVAQLALKHRQNKKQQQRIIVFAGSPVKYDKKALEVLGKKLKKNSVALDIVDFGEEEDEKPEKLEALITSANNNDSSHIVHIPPGSNALSDVLISTPIFTGDAGGGSAFAAAGGGMSGFEFGVDPNVDPELALALRISMEEERARQEAAAKKASDDADKQEKTSSFQGATTSDAIGDESAMSQEAVAMSLDKSEAAHSSGITTVDADMTGVVDDDLELALQMSMQGTVEDSTTGSEMNTLLGDQSFISSIIASLPGVDPNDPSLKDLLTSLPGQSEDKKNEDGGDDKEDKQ